MAYIFVLSGIIETEVRFPVDVVYVAPVVIKSIKYYPLLVAIVNDDVGYVDGGF